MSSLANSLTLSIAGVGVTIKFPGPDWLGRFEQRYYPFMGGGPSALEVQVQSCSHTQPEPDIKDEVSFQDGIALLRSPTYHGFINSEDHIAQICIREDQPIVDIDYCLRVVYALLAFQAGGFLFHGAGIIHHQKGYLFFGHSGAGKTTISRLSSGDQVMNDDLIILMPPESTPDQAIGQSLENKPQHWSMHATPFWNPSQVKPNRLSCDLAAMFHLVKDKEVFLEPLRKAQAFAELVAGVRIIPLDVHQGINVLDRIERLQKQVPVYNLHFLPNASFWKLIEGL
jgi:hypothetical protein